MSDHRSTIRRSLLASCATLVALQLVACGSRRAVQTDVLREPKAGSLEVTSVPIGAGVLEGERRLGNTPLIVERPGGTRLTLQLVKDGYRPHEFSTVVPEGTRLRLHANLQRWPATLIVRAGPIRGAKVSVDGVSRASTPEQVEVDAGEHLIAVDKIGFHPYSERIQIKAGETLEVDAFLVPLSKKVPPTGWLLVKTDKPALIYLDGVMLGMSPLRKIRLPTKKYRVELRRDKILPPFKTAEVTIKRDEISEITAAVK
jgi:hypothetical protein